MTDTPSRRLRPSATVRASLTAAAAALILGACTTAEPAPTPDDSPTQPGAASAAPPGPALGGYGVSAGHPLAAEAGDLMLERGGSAVDAAIAAAFADAVMQPASSGIGGGGVSIVVGDGEATNYEYREVVNQAGQIPDGGAGIPGFVAGMERLHRDHGNLPWADLLAPAIKIADEGGPVSRYLASSINSPYGQDITGALPQFRRADGTPLQEGDTLVQADLAETMRNLAEEGAGSFYTGTLAQTLAQTPGIDHESLAAYQVDTFEPASGPVGRYTMLSGAPALPGAAIIQMVQIAEAAGIADVDPDSPEFVDLLSRAWQVADTSVQQHFGDPRYVNVPVDRLTDPGQNAQIAATLVDAAQASKRSAAQGGYESAPNTTHISVIDADGTAVSMTNTITNYWGSGQYVAGFFLNDQLERFSDIGAMSANLPEPGRRSVTWSSPSMLLDDQGRPVLVIGTPGGRQIPSTTANVVVRWALHRQSLEDAVRAGRFILTDGQLRLETRGLADPMAALGYDVVVSDQAELANYGSVQALAVDWDEGKVTSFADERRSAGFVVGR
ncbi:gamma-glutamyltranspeptidase / glutathione hydrolase [Promicromonospora umidemergens]|uniref:Gamma-glutamyltransferase n=3 Tax=Promicromonospora TaxID=43676 RepID=A0ABW4V855_9MICO|nr:gamma-glutamyltransferase [Promicromonospora umidemergens]MCP2286747.1 gamma-glutamyltranspeptidase / glutathione hydrolase [Promicromonospora umidemergens]